MPNNRKLLEIVEQTSRPRWELEEERIDPSRNTFEWRVFSCRKKNQTSDFFDGIPLMAL